MKMDSIPIYGDLWVKQAISYFAMPCFLINNKIHLMIRKVNMVSKTFPCFLLKNRWHNYCTKAFMRKNGRSCLCNIKTMKAKLMKDNCLKQKHLNLSGIKIKPNYGD